MNKLDQLAKDIKKWGLALGFQQVGICDVDLHKHEEALNEWLSQGYHGELSYMESHGTKRSRPKELVPGTIRVISVRMNYLPPDASFSQHLSNPNIGYISRYALGRDYHKVIRNRLKKLGEKIQKNLENTEFRPFVDSAPVLEHAIAEKAGIGWTGKHSLTINSEAGSWFFLGELFINLPLPTDEPVAEQCGNCTACLTICPTNAIVKPYTVDARKCISYLTIEFDGVIPEEYRKPMGNRIYGCDDCQLVCPWNKESDITDETDFHPRNQLHGQQLLTLFTWSETEFLRNTEGSAIRRIGYDKWRRNLSIALGNAPFDQNIIENLKIAIANANSVLLPHIEWAIEQQQLKKRSKEAILSRQTSRLIRVVQKGLPRDA